MSKDDMGLFFISLSVAWGGSLIAQWGTSILAVKWVAFAQVNGDSKATRVAVWSLIIFTVLQGLPVALGILIFSGLSLKSLIWAAWVISISLQNLLPEVLRGFNDIKWASLLSGPIPQLFSVAAIAMAHFLLKDVGFEIVAPLIIISSLACSAFGIMIVISRAHFTFQLHSYRGFLIESTPIALSLGATYILSQADLWACGTLLARSDVAVYGIAQRFNAIISMPMMIFGSVVMPTLAELMAKGDLKRLHSVVSRGTFITSVCTLTVYLGAGLVGFPAMRILFGEAYTAAFPLFMILGLGQVLSAVSGPNGYLLLLCGQQKAAMVATLAAVVVLVASAWFGGTYFGAIGIASASTLALTVQTIWMWTQVRSRIKISSHFQWISNWRDV